MKVVILAAGWGSRLKPLTDDRPKCMVEVNGKSIIERQLDVMRACGVNEKEITIIAGYRNDVLKSRFQGTEINFIVNSEFETTNMVCSLMCAKHQMEQEQDAAEGTVGHLRMDFGGGRLHHSWWPHNDDRLNTPAFKAVLQAFMDEMRERGPLKGGTTMRRWCSRHPAGEIGKEQFGFIAETENYRFCLRCTTLSGDYCYLYCYDLNQQKLAMAGKETRYGLTETGLQALRDAADPSKPHTYSWYVIENINTSALRVDHELPLDEAIELYAGLDCADKRLGVTKDDITAVDLVIRYDGREWLSEDRLKLASFKDDPVVAGAVVKLQQMLEAAPVIGRVTFASGEAAVFTDPEKYLQTVREELPYHATTGFRCETLTDDPEIRKAVDDMLCDLYGEENPRTLEDYGNTGMTMGGIT